MALFFLLATFASSVSAFATTSPTPPATTSTERSVSSSLCMNKRKQYSAEWIDLLSLESSPRPGQIKPPRSGAQTISCDGKILTFAGYVEEVADTAVERYVVNDLWEFVPYQENCESWGWKQVVAAGDDESPGPRLAFAMASMPSSSNAFVIGGWDPMVPGTGGIILDDVSVLNVQSLKWSTPTNADNSEKLSTIPGGPTSRHVAVALADDTICLHNHRCEDHVKLLRTSSEEQNKVRWEHRKTSGEAPSSRGLHCASTLASYSDGISKTKAMVIFGGAAQNGLMSNESFVLDATTWKWTKLDCGETTPSPRAGACLCALDDNSVLLFGGAMSTEGGLLGLNDVWVLNVESGKGRWECLLKHQSVVLDNSSSAFPPGRNAATLTEINARKILPINMFEEGCKYYLLQGGWAPFRKTYDDVFLLRVSTK